MPKQSWDDALANAADPRVRDSLEILYEGHRRFREGAPQTRAYTPEDLDRIATRQRPVAAIVACSDSRVAPEILFDQPLGSVFASRVPGNVASDSAKWMLEIAVSELHVPLVMVLGHTGCLAVGQIVEGRSGPGGSMRLDVQKALHRARLDNPPDVYRAAVEQNVLLAVENLRRDSYAVQRALERREVGIIGAVYDMAAGEVTLLSQALP